VSGPEAGAPFSPTRRQALAGIAADLESAGIDNAAAEAERLLAHVLGIERHEVILGGSEPLGPEEAGSLGRAVARRLAGAPLQHIEGTAAFREIVLVADGRALVPRPETEQLVQLIADWARRKDSPLEDALDIGTGSGAIALSLVHERIVRHVVGVDVSPTALEQAAENVARAGLAGGGETCAGGSERQRAAGSIELRQVGPDLWSELPGDERFDLIVSNPPYVTDAELDVLPRDVREHDPRVALAGGVDGLDVVRLIATGAAAHLRSGGALFLEIGETQAQGARRAFASTGEWNSVEVRRDLAGRDRFLIARPVASGCGEEMGWSGAAEVE